MIDKWTKISKVSIIRQLQQRTMQDIDSRDKPRKELQSQNPLVLTFERKQDQSPLEKEKLKK